MQWQVRCQLLRPEGRSLCKQGPLLTNHGQGARRQTLPWWQSVSRGDWPDTKPENIFVNGSSQFLPGPKHRYRMVVQATRFAMPPAAGCRHSACRFPSRPEEEPRIAGRTKATENPIGLMPFVSVQQAGVSIFRRDVRWQGVCAKARQFQHQDRSGYNAGDCMETLLSFAAYRWLQLLLRRQRILLHLKEEVSTL